MPETPETASLMAEIRRVEKELRDLIAQGAGSKDLQEAHTEIATLKAKIVELEKAPARKPSPPKAPVNKPAPEPEPDDDGDDDDDDSPFDL